MIPVVSHVRQRPVAPPTVVGQPGGYERKVAFCSIGRGRFPPPAAPFFQRQVGEPLMPTGGVQVTDGETLLLENLGVFFAPGSPLPQYQHGRWKAHNMNHTIDNAKNGYGRCSALSVWMPAAHEERLLFSFPSKPMGQYFAAVNTDKMEFVCPWCIGGGAKLWEWAANPTGGIFILLLRQSSGGGGGDFHDPWQRPRTIDVSGKTPSQAASCVMDAIALGVAAEGRPITTTEDTIAGRWAGDHVTLVGDYDDSGLWNELYRSKSYRNISQQLVETWNDFIQLEDYKLSYNPQCSCQSNE